MNLGIAVHVVLYVTAYLLLWEPVKAGEEGVDIWMAEEIVRSRRCDTGRHLGKVACRATRRRGWRRGRGLSERQRCPTEQRRSGHGSGTDHCSYRAAGRTAGSQHPWLPSSSVRRSSTGAATDSK